MGGGFFSHFKTEVRVMAHDLRQQKNKAGIEMIVRPKNRYGSAGPGEVVLVDAREINNGATRSACMTKDEAEELQRRIEAKEREAEERQKTMTRRSISAIVDKGLALLGQKKEETEPEPEPEVVDAADAAAARASSQLVDAASREPAESVREADQDEFSMPSLGKKKKKVK